VSLMVKMLETIYGISIVKRTIIFTVVFLKITDEIIN